MKLIDAKVYHCFCSQLQNKINQKHFSLLFLFVFQLSHVCWQPASAGPNAGPAPQLLDDQEAQHANFNSALT
jgi:hypothetical protein